MSNSIVFIFFFFSSRRRHTRFDCDWSSDVCSSDLLKKNRHYRSELSFEDESLHPVSDDHPEVNFSAKELADMIRQLPAGYQTIFNLHAVEGYTHVEIGKIMGISEVTSRSQYMRARNLLITWINKQTNDIKEANYAGK